MRVYLNLGEHYQMMKKCNQAPNTPNVTLFLALDAALDWTLTCETLDDRIARYQWCTKKFARWYARNGVKISPSGKSNVAYGGQRVPVGRKGCWRVCVCTFLFGYTVYPGKGKYLAMNMFQIANMSAIYPEDCRKFLDDPKTVIQ